jgi:hypothetical protein
MNPQPPELHVTETHLVIAVLTLILVYGLKFLQELLKDRRDRKHDESQINVLKDIVSINNEIRNGQIAQNGKLSAVVSVNEAHHLELIRCLNRLPCPPTNQPKDV